MLPTGLKLDELLEAGEEIFRDCENTDPKQQGSVDVLSLARRIVELVQDCPIVQCRILWEQSVLHSNIVLYGSQTSEVWVTSVHRFQPRKKPPCYNSTQSPQDGGEQVALQ